MMSAPKVDVGAQAARLLAEADGVVAQVAALHPLQDQVVAGLQATGADAASAAARWRSPASAPRPPRSSRSSEMRRRGRSGTSCRIRSTRSPSRGCAGRSAPQEVRSTPVSTTSLKPRPTSRLICSTTTPGGDGAGIAAAVGDDAEGAAVVAAVLHLHIGAVRVPKPSIRWPAVSVDRHDVVDLHPLGLADEVGRQARPGLGPHLLGIADDAVDLGHGGEGLGLGLRGAAGDDRAARPGSRARSRRISCRALRTASAVTAQVFTTTASSSPAPAASSFIASVS